MNDRHEMNCEEFEIVGLDSHRDTSLSDDSRQRALRHVRLCARCSALAESWRAAQMELAALGECTRDASAPSAVETRLLQHFRLKHQSKRDRQTLKFATWTLAAALVLVCMVSVWDWHKWRRESSHNLPAAGGSVAQITNSGSPETLIAGNGEGDFTQLPGSSTQAMEDAAIIHVGMQRASLAAFGLPVNEERAGDWIQVDLLVGNDGSPQAVRLPE